MKLVRFTIITFLMVFLTAPNVFAAEHVKKPLEQIFNSAVVIPFDYKDKIFAGGQFFDLTGNKYKVFKQNGRVFIPMKLMAFAINLLDESTWSLDQYNLKKPDDITLINYNNSHTIMKLKVNSNVAYLGKKEITLEAPIQKIKGTICISARSITQLLGEKVEWVNGLLVISNEQLDVKHPKTVEVAEKIKTSLTDVRKEVTAENQNYIEQLAYVNGKTAYYVKGRNVQDKYYQDLYKAENKKEVKISTPQDARFSPNHAVNNELYFIASKNNKPELFALNLINDKVKNLNMGKTPSPDWGWMGNIRYINNELYIIMHYGDWTMGSENLYIAEKDQSKKLADAKSFITYTKYQDNLYFSDFLMSGDPDNLSKLNLKTLKKENIGLKGFSYDYVKTTNKQGTTIQGIGSLYAKDGYLYAIGFKDNSGDDSCGVYKINLKNNTQTKITPPAKMFWLVGNEIYYLDYFTGYLNKVDLAGKQQKQLVKRRIVNAQIYNGDLYYMDNKDNRPSYVTGIFYKFNLKTGQEKQLSKHSIQSYFVSKLGVYYKSDAYDMGLYRVATDGKSTCLVNDAVNLVLLTDEGLAYTLRYKEGVYTTR